MRILKNKKGFVSVLSEIYIYLVFVLVVLIFLMLYMISKNQINNRVKNDFQANEANLVLNNIINEQVEFNGKTLSLGELLGYYLAVEKQSYWEDQVNLKGLIEKTFKERFETIYGPSHNWKLIIDFPQTVYIDFMIGDKTAKGTHYSQVIPRYNPNEKAQYNGASPSYGAGLGYTNDIYIEFYPPT